MKLEEIKPIVSKPLDKRSSTTGTKYSVYSDEVPKLEFFGWNTEEGNDKIWAVIKFRESNETHPFYKPGHPASFNEYKQFDYLAVWGKREGRKLQSKIIGNESELDRYNSGEFTGDVGVKIRDKIEKGYESIDLSQVERICPAIKEFLKK